MDNLVTNGSNFSVSPDVNLTGYKRLADLYYRNLHPLLKNHFSNSKKGQSVHTLVFVLLQLGAKQPWKELQRQSLELRQKDGPSRGKEILMNYIDKESLRELQHTLCLLVYSHKEHSDQV
jgi:hypothetical protein